MTSASNDSYAYPPLPWETRRLLSPARTMSYWAPPQNLWVAFGREHRRLLETGGLWLSGHGRFSGATQHPYFQWLQESSFHPPILVKTRANEHA